MSYADTLALCQQRELAENKEGKKNSLVSTWQRKLPVVEEVVLCARKVQSVDECDLVDAKSVMLMIRNLSLLLSV